MRDLRPVLLATYRQLQSIVTTWHNENHGYRVCNECSRVGCVETLAVLETARRALELSQNANEATHEDDNGPVCDEACRV
jgi:predicted NBD/HSP70 family sugar kinase